MMHLKTNEAGFGTPVDIERCRAVDIGVQDYAECLRSGPNTCKFAVPFGYCFLCHHPMLDVIIHQTYAARQAGSHTRH